MTVPKIRELRALVVRGGGGDYHDQDLGHWIDTRVSTPMSRYPQYRETRRSFGLNILGTLVIEIEADDGTVGIGVTTGGEVGAWIAEVHFARFIEGQRVDDIETMWDQMFNASLFYGRRGITVNVISGVDLALWDLLGRVRQEPVWHLLGGKKRDRLQCYATGPRPDLAKDMGFIGGKMPLVHAPAEGEDGLKANVQRLAEMRAKVGSDFWLMYDCWMSLSVPYATRLVEACAPYDLKWLEEALPPDDYWGYGDLHRAVGDTTWVTTGEHEATRWGFRLLIEMDCCDMIQPDVGWCGGLTELIRIADLADEAGIMVVPHGSSVYSYHFSTSRSNSPFTEFIVMSPKADRIVPMYDPLLVGEPLPENGVIEVPESPGFGVELNRDLSFQRPHEAKGRARESL